MYSPPLTLEYGPPLAKTFELTSSIVHVTSDPQQSVLISNKISCPPIVAE